MSSIPAIKKLDMVQEGVSPIVFDNWRKETFAHILDSKAGSLLAGSFLAYERGHADFLILANPECPYYYKNEFETGDFPMNRSRWTATVGPTHRVD